MHPRGVYADETARRSLYFSVIKSRTHVLCRQLVFSSCSRTLGRKLWFMSENSKLAVLRVAAYCILVETRRFFGGTCCFHRQGDRSVPKRLRDATLLKTVIFFSGMSSLRI